MFSLDKDNLMTITFQFQGTSFEIKKNYLIKTTRSNRSLEIKINEMCLKIIITKVYMESTNITDNTKNYIFTTFHKLFPNVAIT